MAVDPERYHALLGRALDDDLAPADGEALAQLLAGDPGLREDFQRHLALWDLWAQHTVPERSAASFLAAWKTRLAAEAGAEAFSTAVRTRLEAATTSRARPGFWRRLGESLHGVLASLRRPAALAWTAGMTAAMLLGLLWLAWPRSAQATITLRGEAVCTACVLHQTHQCSEAIRVTEGGLTRIYHLEHNHSFARMQGRFCNGPTPAVVTGKLATHGERLLFEAASVVLPEPPKPRPPRSKDERILFPF